MSYITLVHIIGTFFIVSHYTPYLLHIIGFAITGYYIGLNSAVLHNITLYPCIAYDITNLPQDP